MITTPTAPASRAVPAPKPVQLTEERLNALLAGLLDPQTPFEGVAAAVGLTVDQLITLLDTPAMQDRLARLERTLTQRSRLVTVASQTAAVGALSTVIDELGSAGEQRAKVESALAEAQAEDDEEAIDEAATALVALDHRTRELTEIARSAAPC
ncbi:MAG: hypothetical protein ACFHWZ_09885 [Phycisphaerales bacterium]